LYFSLQVFEILPLHRNLWGKYAQIELKLSGCQKYSAEITVIFYQMTVKNHPIIYQNLFWKLRPLAKHSARKATGCQVESE
jgi:hypothetical protein